MAHYFSPTTKSFFCKSVNGSAIPADAKPISRDLYEQLKGRAIDIDADGMPCLYVAPPPTFAQRQATLLAAVDEHLNAAAHAKGYDSIVTAALRAALPNSAFHDEGVAFGTWMDAVYAKCYEVLALVIAGELAEPDKEQLLALLPPLNLPASKGG